MPAYLDLLSQAGVRPQGTSLATIKVCLFTHARLVHLALLHTWYANIAVLPVKAYRDKSPEGAPAAQRPDPNGAGARVAVRAAVAEVSEGSNSCAEAYLT